MDGGASDIGGRQDAVPSGQEYELGYYRDGGEWTEVETASFDRDWLVDGGYDRVQSVHAGEGHDLRLRGTDDDTVYEVPDSGLGGSYGSQTAEGRDTVTTE